jgi:hypothetical protein
VSALQTKVGIHIETVSDSSRFIGHAFPNISLMNRILSRMYANLQLWVGSPELGNFLDLLAQITRGRSFMSHPVRSDDVGTLLEHELELFDLVEIPGVIRVAP